MRNDDTEKTIVILKPQADSLISAEVFLKNRGWTLYSTANLKEALVFLVQKQPRFVMISIDHANPKVMKLPRILKQAFPAGVLAYSEKSSIATYTLLGQIGTDYVLYPPVTGPAIERTVHRYYRDLEQQKNKARNSGSLGDANEADDSTIAIRGNTYANTDVQNILAQMMGEDAFQALMPGASLNLGRTNEQGTPGSLLSHMQKGGLGRVINTRRTPEELHQDPRATKKESLMLRGSTTALENSCQKISATENVQGLGAPTNVACLIVDSTRFSGYLLTVMQPEAVIDNEFIQLVYDRLLKFLKDHGEDIGATPMDLKIRRVPFEDWALKHAEFLRKSVHEGKDVAMAFFPCKRLNITVEHINHEMAAVALEDLHADAPVEFNLYLYLPRNNKYVLYTPRGGTFYGVQKERLHAQGISKLHILKADLADLPKYQAQSFLNQKIKEYEDEVAQQKEPVSS